MQAQMLAPAAALVCWSLVMLMWMVVTRFKAFSEKGIDLTKSPPGGRGSQLDGVLPDSVMWKSHNYAHLMEQPTIFYPAAIILAATSASMLDVWLAWIYVASRVVHSLYQSTVNRVSVRVKIFAFSTTILGILAVRALIATLTAAAV